MRTMTKRVVAVLGCGVMLAGLLSGCGQAAEEAVTETNIIVVDVQTATRGSIRLQGSYVGNVGAGESVNIIPMANATVEDVKVAVGSQVSEGQVLAKLDSTAADLNMANAQAAYDSAMAQAQSALGSTWNTNIYKAEQGIGQLSESIDTINKQIDDLKNSTAYKSAKNGRDAAKSALDVLNKVKAAWEATASINVTVTASNQSALTTYFAITSPTVGTSVTIAMNADPADEANKYNNADSHLCSILTTSGLSETGLDEATITNIKVVCAYLQGGNTLAALGTNISTADGAYQQAKIAFEQVESQITALETQRDSLKTQLETAQGTLDITKTQTYSDTVNSLQKGLAQAQVGLDSASYQQSLYTITSPINGIIESVGLVKDGFATSSAVAFTISNKESMVVTFYVAEDVRDELALGQDVTVTRGKNSYSGVVTEIGNAVDMTKGLFKVKATVYNAPDIATGVTATVSTTCHRDDNVIVIPCDAVYYEGGEAYVFVYHNGTAVKTPVETGIYDDSNIAVLSGLIDGQQVITTWSPNLVDGAAVALPGEGDDSASES